MVEKETKGVGGGKAKVSSVGAHRRYGCGVANRAATFVGETDFFCYSCEYF
jgi:hypothetical protein